MFEQPFTQSVGLKEQVGSLLSCAQARNINLCQAPSVEVMIADLSRGLSQFGKKGIDSRINTKALQGIAQTHRQRPVLQ
ncbi:hypothetical protein D3C77_293800 [compost metagenome]